MPIVVGAPRSGTTLLRLMLDAHPELAIPPETSFLRLGPELLERGVGPDEFARTLIGFPASAPAWADFGVTEEAFHEALGRLDPFSVADGFRTFYRLYAARFGKDRWGDKTPLYCKAIEPIRRVLPEARFVHIVRDGRDAALSLGRTWFSPGPEIETQAVYWRDCVTAARASGLGHPDYLEVRFEALVGEPAHELTKICAFVDLDFDSAMLDYHRDAPQRLSEHGTRWKADGTTLVTGEARLAQVRRVTTPPDARRVFAWKDEMLPEDQRRFADVAGPLLRELGYDAS